MHKHKKNLQNITHYALEFQLTKGLYPKHEMFEIVFPLEPVPTSITLITYGNRITKIKTCNYHKTYDKVGYLRSCLQWAR